MKVLWDIGFGRAPAVYTGVIFFFWDYNIFAVPEIRILS